jgi:2,3-dihydroxybenzoate decarboxylase
LKGFAALPLQDPQAAAEELTRCVKALGFCGALTHGFLQVGGDSIVYHDLPQYRAFWGTAQQLDVPFYIPVRPWPHASTKGTHGSRDRRGGSRSRLRSTRCV